MLLWYELIFKGADYEKFYRSPSRYIQGENALFENAQSISELALCDSVVYMIL